jgi:transposase
VARSRVELFEQIRRDQRAEGSSIRELADRHRVHRRTVRQALASAVPPPRKAYPRRRRPAIDRYAGVIDGWLLADRDAPRKQRHTARRVWQRLVAEHDATLAEVTVSRYVARRRAELGSDRVEVSVPQAHLLGAGAEVDFGEFHASIAGTLAKLWMFVMRLPHSGLAFHVAFATQAQEAFLEGHVLAFEYFGAVPGRVRYDNLKPAVVRVLRGRDRPESERFIALRSHYGFDSFFCIPGKQGAHEKGGVEGEIGRFRRRHLGPVHVVRDGRELGLGGPKPRAVLALLLVEPGRVVPAEYLAEVLWRGAPPPGAAQTLRSYVSRLRSLLEPDAALVAQGGGYALTVDPDRVDASKFERLVGAGRDALGRGEVAAAADRFAEGLALWRGVPRHRHSRRCRGVGRLCSAARLHASC